MTEWETSMHADAHRAGKGAEHVLKFCRAESKAVGR